MNDRVLYNIGKWNVPREYTTCPSCGLQYGHHNTKVCRKCEECSKCCRCKIKSNHETADVAVPIILNGRL
jgi:hypothetical protein